ncbi:hypothetical protein FHX75_11272 [Micromonospora palomenae]|uniref:Uncharacterized protein n=1 Tax=Micromonospora palomenae TaxID=1461247 RepID=A0A561WTI0_9ACTN|nr:hypothetical protein [Micromonospora palomenae]TWG27137.1 hypothetical protein FHX75_11272 [Micromonospora palomenae]
MRLGVHVGRLVATAVLLGWLPAAAVLPSLVALAVVVGILAALIAGETVRYADLPRAVGHG